MPNIPIQGLPYRKEGLADIIQPSVDLYTKWKMEMEPKLALEKLQQDMALQKILQDAQQHQETLGETSRHNRADEGKPVNTGGGTAWTSEGGFQQIAPWKVPPEGYGGVIMPPGMGGAGATVPPALSQPSGVAPAAAGIPGLQPQGAPPALNILSAPGRPDPLSDLRGRVLESQITKNEAQARRAGQPTAASTRGQVTPQDRWKSEEGRRQKATTALQTAHAKYLEDWNYLQDQIAAIETNSVSGKTNWADMTTEKKTAIRDRLWKRQEQLTKQYHSRARSAGWDEQGQWAAGGKRAGATAARGKLQDPALAQQYLQRAGGDKAKARQLAKTDGWEL